jgi:ABC-type multidrug transport system fused ATPase/permease subunit
LLIFSLEMNSAFSLFVLISDIWRHLTRHRQRQFLILTGLMLISAFAEVVSIGAVLPFLSILVAPDEVYNHPIVYDMAKDWDITSANQLIWPLTVAFAMAAVIAGSIRILLLWFSNRLAFATGADFGIEVYRRTLQQPYQTHVARNSSEVISGITNKVNGVVFAVLLPLLTIISSTVLLLAILLTLIAIDPLVASVAAIGFVFFYVLMTRMTRKRLRRNSQVIAQEQTQVIKALQEGLGGIRDVLLDGTQQVYCDIYSKANLPLSKAQSNNAFLGQSPRFIVESLGMVMIAFLAYVLSKQDGGIGTALPMLGALALGAQRLIPALQLIYYAWASIAGTKASLSEAIALLDQPLPREVIQATPVVEPLDFQKNIRFEDVRFRYTSNGPWVVDGLNLTIPKGARVGFVGSTGSGKSTAIDLLMGLLNPAFGNILVDDLPICSNYVRAWQLNIAHVPQSIFLSDTTIAENIAFGLPLKDIDMKRVQKCARQAQIEDFIESNPQKYLAFVGERGIRLSGGQRQRIGIARALYKQASLLVLDEATSSLDNYTELAVMDAIQSLNRELTIVLIAHRLTTVRHCDFIVELEEGKLIAQGTYDQLIEKSPSFSKMANIL